MADFLRSLERMLQAGHRPSAWLLLRLTDGRTKLFGDSEDIADSTWRTSLSNQLGPWRLLLRVRYEEKPASGLFRVDNLGDTGPARVE
jgi:hypothetical protein